jgi:hypothetical protein
MNAALWEIALMKFGGTPSNKMKLVKKEAYSFEHPQYGIVKRKKYRCHFFERCKGECPFCIAVFLRIEEDDYFIMASASLSSCVLPTSLPQTTPIGKCKCVCPLYSFERTVLFTILTTIVTLILTQTVVVAHDEKIMRTGLDKRKCRDIYPTVPTERISAAHHPKF